MASLRMLVLVRVVDGEKTEQQAVLHELKEALEKVFEKGDARFDTRIWPERQSFSGRDLGPVPAKWKGECVAGKSFLATSCNRNIIGVRYFSEGYEATNGKLNKTVEFRSTRDSNGHNTHTASIAAGRYVSPASTLGYAKGLGGCYGSDILASFDAVMADGVDVVSLSIGGVVVPYQLNEIAIDAFDATSAGVFVSSSAGNGGPGAIRA
ncbi:Subtilisin-like protease [Vigna angularis]|uniref:Subtilisin-like protease n=1 Tax=Phaseolus angularis TaxID=3914 RepID=A0A8T0JQS6_PHAAN|nr:Subtilisin-like protease [Vigna angularis]